MVELTGIDAPSTIGHIDQWYEDNQELPRAHLGASQIGKECLRDIWYSFHWCLPKKFDGRLLRLFEFGGTEAEQMLIKYLSSVGVRVMSIDPDTGRQFNFMTLGGHFAGSCDGMADGIIEAPATRHLLEFKTSNDKQFNELQKHGVEKHKPEHLAQMQLYMHFLKLKRAYYLVLNKNDHRLYGERVRYNATHAKQLIDRARMVLDAAVPPTRISEDPSWYKCQWCDHKTLCHHGEMPEVNCRTCLHSTPVVDDSNDAKWHCNFYGDSVPLDFQRKGCPKHLFIPDMVPYECTGGDQENNLVEYQHNGRRFWNGEKDEDIYPSDELRHFNPAIFDDPVVQGLEQAFGKVEIIERTFVGDSNAN